MSAQALTAGTAAEMGSDPNLSTLEYHMTEFVTMGYILRPKTIEISYLFCFVFPWGAWWSYGPDRCLPYLAHVAAV